MTTEEFIRRSREVHGDRYGYEQSSYVDQQTKIRIFCRSCQKYYEQIPQKHYAKGEGCWECGVKKRSRTQSKTFDEFLIDARKKHGHRYEYDGSTYESDKKKLKIACRACGNIFEQRANSHLRGSGCPRCAVIRVHAKQSYGGAGFLERARKIHGDKFEYLGCDSRNWSQRSTVTWRCRDCGLMKDQLVMNHLAGRGCVKCSRLSRRCIV